MNRIIQILVALAFLAIPTAVFAQGGPPTLPPSTPSQAEQQRENQAHPVNLAQVQATIARRAQRMLAEGLSVPDHNQPKPPDAVPPHLRRDPNGPTPPTGPRPPEPARRSEEPSYGLLGLLDAPLAQSAIQCGAGNRAYLESYVTQRVQSIMFCHSPLSFFTSQSMNNYHTDWVWNASQGWHEQVWWDDHILSCGRWAYDWTAWTCNQDGSYGIDGLRCQQWSRTITYVYGYSPGDGSTYFDALPTGWVQGCMSA